MAEDITKHRIQCSYRIAIGSFDKATTHSRGTTHSPLADLDHQPPTVRPRDNFITESPNKTSSSYWIHNHCQDTSTHDHIAHSSKTSTSPVLTNDGPTIVASSSTQNQLERQDIIPQNSPYNSDTPTTAEQQPTSSGDTDQPSTQLTVDRNKVVKEDALLCMALISSGNEKLPTRYKKRDANSYKRQGDWRQLETVLTPSALACYNSTALSWPHRTLEHWIPLDSKTDPSLSLYLFSPLDFTFCIQYTPTHTNQPLTLMFRARSFGLCQNWYSILYQFFPTESKKTLPLECDIYLPVLDLHVHVPLMDNYQFITMRQVKETVVDLLKVDPNGLALLEKNHSEFLLCWTRKDCAEWILGVDGTCQSNLIFRPQLIEKSHQLEIRSVQHTPHTIITSDNITLQEPPPCEGYLIMATDFQGRRRKPWAPGRFYFASFGRFLFVIPSDMANTPDTDAIVNETTLDPDWIGLRAFFKDWVETNPSVELVTPFTQKTRRRDEIDRRTRLIAGASGYIDLTQVAYIQRSDTSPSLTSQQSNTASTYSDDETTSTSAVFHADSLTSPLLQQQNGLDSTRHPCIELVMKNGISIRLEAQSRDTCDLWISCLSDLILYSNAQLEATCDIHGAAYSPGKEGCSTTYVDGSPSTRTESFDTRIWSLCLYNQCHEVVKSGILYVQYKDVFSQKQFILTMDGRLHYFNMYKRSGDDGKPIQTGLHERKGMLELTGAYVYSGQVSVLDSKQPIPLDRPSRLFGDGVTTDDSNEDCFFCLWIPKRRRIYSSQRQAVIVYGPHQRFPSKGSRWLFLAPSRHEMEHWMWSISVVQDQMLHS